MGIIISLLSFIVILGIIVTIHELGHLIMAKRAGIFCHEFSIGMGPKLFKKKFGETYYSIALFPIGGYVAMAGDENENNDWDIPNERLYSSASLLNRFFVSIAGVTMNIILAFFIFLIVALFIGTPVNKNQIGEVAEGGVAESIELQENDKILEIDDHVIETWDDIGEALYETLGQRDIHLLIERDGENIEFKANPRIVIDSIGIADENTDIEEVIVGIVLEGSKADESGMKTGDKIVNIDGKEIETWVEVVDYFKNFNDYKEISLTVERDVEGELVTEELKMTPYTKDFLNSAAAINPTRAIIGISPKTEITIFGVFGSATTNLLDSGSMIFKTLMITFGPNEEAGISDLGGVVSIFNMSGDAASAGFVSFLSFMGLLSINVAILNLLPLPALDGGRIIFISLEAIRKKPVDPKIENKIHGIGILLLFTFMIYITIVDILRFV